jgi:hypothetical protein
MDRECFVNDIDYWVIELGIEEVLNEVHKIAAVLLPDETK